MKCSLGITNFLEVISSLSHSIVFLCFFVLITEEGYLIFPCFSLNSAFKCVYLSFSPLPFTLLLFSAICKPSSDNYFCFLHFSSMWMALLPVSCTMSRTSFHSSSGTLFIRSRPLNLFLTGLEKVSFHSNAKERQCQRMLKLPHNYIHLTC